MTTAPLSEDTAEVVTTVAGDIAPEALGRALTHEHVLTDLTPYYVRDPDPDIARELERGVVMSNLGHLRRSLSNSYDDQFLDDDDLAATELRRFVDAGGQGICEVSSHGIRQPDHAQRLVGISRASGAHIVLGTGVYVASHHPDDIGGLDEDELYELFVTELNVGVGGTEVRCGTIGEMGLGNPPKPQEEAALRAAARAAVATGASVIVHQTDPTGSVAHHALDVLEAAGVPLEKVAIGHAGVWVGWPVFEAVLRRGCFVAIDTIGLSGSIGAMEFPSENGYESMVRAVIDAGFVAQLLVSQDVCHKRHLRHYGGVGYDHLLTGLIPRLAQSYPASVVEQILVGNPRALLRRPVHQTYA